VFENEIEFLDLVEHFKTRYPVMTGFTEPYMNLIIIVTLAFLVPTH